MPNEVIHRVDLGELTKVGNHSPTFLTEQHNGAGVRTRAGLDSLDDDPGVVEIHIPEEVALLTTRFATALLGPSVRRFGEHEFREKYRFTGADFRDVIDRAIRNALFDFPDTASLKDVAVRRAAE